VILASPFALLWLLLVPLVIALHSLTVRWRRKEISSLAFWNEVLRENRTSIRVRRILRNLALLAEVLAIAVLALALARPLLAGRSGQAGDAILVLDATASMQAREGGRTRFDLARERAFAEVAALRRDGRMLVIRAGLSPRILAGFTADREALRRAVRGAAPGDETGNLGSALALAFSLRSAARGDRVVVVTDNAFDSVGPVDLAHPWIRWVSVGSSRANAGITALAFRRTADRDGGYEMFLSVENFAPVQVSFPLTVSAGAAEVVREQVSLGPGQARALSVPWTGPTTGRVTAAIGASDDLDADNRAFAVFAPARAVRVRLVGPRNVFLESALSALPNVTVFRTEQVPAGTVDGGEADLTVYDGVVPTVDAPGTGGPAIVFNSVPRGLPVRSAGVREGLRIDAVDRRHPLTASVTLEGTSIARALRLEPGPGFATLAGAGGQPLILAWDQPGRKLLLLGFDIRESDLPLRAAFPVLMANALEWFFPSWLSVHAEQARAGASVLLAPVGEGPVAVTLPGGARRTLAAGAGPAGFAETSAAGFYRVEAAGRVREFAVSLASGEESRIAPRFETGAAELPAPQAPGQSPNGTGAAGERADGVVPAWGVFALAGFVLLVLEWLAWLRVAAPARAGRKA
jgi:Ca-activated chloride channel homolog